MKSGGILVKSHVAAVHEPNEIERFDRCFVSRVKTPKNYSTTVPRSCDLSPDEGFMETQKEKKTALDLQYFVTTSTYHIMLVLATGRTITDYPYCTVLLTV